MKETGSGSQTLWFEKHTVMAANIQHISQQIVIHRRQKPSDQTSDASSSSSSMD
jgi:hypothetical protein